MVASRNTRVIRDPEDPEFRNRPRPPAPNPARPHPTPVGPDDQLPDNRPRDPTTPPVIAPSPTSPDPANPVPPAPTPNPPSPAPAPGPGPVVEVTVPEIPAPPPITPPPPVDPNAVAVPQWLTDLIADTRRDIGELARRPAFAPVSAPSVGDELSRLIRSDSDFIKSAETRGLQQANRRGLLNSSIGVGAAMTSAIDAAGPLAMADASNKLAANLQAQQLNANREEREEQFLRQKQLFGLESAVNFQQQDIKFQQDAALADVNAQLQRGTITVEAAAASRARIMEQVAAAQINVGTAQFLSDVRVDEQTRIDAARFAEGMKQSVLASQLEIPKDYGAAMTALYTTVPPLSPDQIKAGGAAITGYFQSRLNATNAMAEALGLDVTQTEINAPNPTAPPPANGGATPANPGGGAATPDGTNPAALQSGSFLPSGQNPPGMGPNISPYTNRAYSNNQPFTGSDGRTYVFNMNVQRWQVI